MKRRVIAMGASGDGIHALSRIVAALPRDLDAPVFIVQHLGRKSSGFLPEILARAAQLPVAHPRQGELVVPRRIYVAPPDHHMLVREGHVLLSCGPRENYTRPSIDVLFRSLALAYGPAAVGVVLTGYLDDGTAGLLAIKERGGVTVIQDPLTAAVPSMPESARRLVPIDHTCHLDDIAPLLVHLVEDPIGEPRPPTPILEIEDRIAAGQAGTDDLGALLVGATISRTPCPLCASPLFRIDEDRLPRLRCRTGHGFNSTPLANNAG